MVQEQYKQLLVTTHDCMVACNFCYDECFKEDDVKMLAECIQLDRECADICAYLEKAISSDSSFVKEIASVCAKICGACAEECEKHDHDHCRKCAIACRNCEEACKNVA